MFKFVFLFFLSALSLQGFCASEEMGAEPSPSYAMGLLRSPPEAAQLLKAYDIAPEPDYKLPTKCSLNYLLEDLPIYDQGSLGACTAHAISTALWGRMKYLEQIPFKVSRLFTYYNSRLEMGDSYLPEDSGATFYHVFQSLKTYGFCNEELWEYDIHKFTQKPSVRAYEAAKEHKVMDELSIAWVGPDLNKIKLSIENGCPVVFGENISSAWINVGKEGIIPSPRRKDRSLGGHAMVITAYDDEDWTLTIRNSWGEEWGNKGTVKISQDDVAFFSEAWAPHNISNGAECAPLLRGMKLVPSTSTIPQDDTTMEDLSEELSRL